MFRPEAYCEEAVLFRWAHFQYRRNRLKVNIASSGSAAVQEWEATPILSLNYPPILDNVGECCTCLFPVTEEMATWFWVVWEKAASRRVFE